MIDYFHILLCNYLLKIMKYIFSYKGTILNDKLETLNKGERLNNLEIYY
jgi:hypothetical protein